MFNFQSTEGKQFSISTTNKNNNSVTCWNYETIAKQEGENAF